MTALNQYGFLGYFNVPSNFVNTSLTNNIIFFFQIFQVGKVLASSLGVMTCALLFMTFATWVIAILGLYWSSKKMKIGLEVAAAILCLVGLWSFYNLGISSAENQETFFIAKSECILKEKDASTDFAAVGYYGGSAILVPYEPKTQKMKGGFMIRDLATMPCKLISTKIGRIHR